MTASPAPELPTLVDVRAMAREATALEGVTPLVAFERLLADLPEQPADLSVAWRARAEWREPVGVAAQLWLHLDVTAEVPLTCQRCLSAYRQPVVIDRWFRFVADEAAALAEDDESEEDLLVLVPRFNLHELLEDELLLALPLVPMHEVCPEPVRLGAADEAAAEGRPHPFAALARLKTGAGGKGT